MSVIRENLKRQVDMMRSFTAPSLPQWRWPYFNVADFLLKEGCEMEVTTDLPEGVKAGELKHCFMNAAQLALENTDRFVYCEGYAWHIIPMAHAWVMDRESGKFFDPTWCGLEEKPKASFIGVPIKDAYLWRVINKTEEWHSVLDWWEADWPILSGEHGSELWRAPVTASINTV